MIQNYSNNNFLGVAKMFIYCMLPCILLLQCIPSKEEKLTEINLDLEDPLYQKIYTFQDQLLSDSLTNYFNHPDPTYRYEAAMACASIKDKTALPSLYPLLKDEIEQVRMATAYAIGQIGEESGSEELVKAFVGDSLASNFNYRSTLLEAVGKCGPISYLKFIATAGPYYRSDTVLLEGQALSIYRFALRKMVLPEGTERMLRFLTKKGYPSSVRMIAANYLYRASNVELNSTGSEDLADVVLKEKDINIKIPLAIALGKTKHPKALQSLKTLYKQEKDYRVKCNIIRGLSNFNYAEADSIVFPALDDPNIHVASTAAQFFVDYGNPQKAVDYWRKAKKDITLPWQVSNLLFKAANRYLPTYFAVTKGNINQELKNRFIAEGGNPHEKSALLDALSEFGWNYKYIKDQAFNSESNIIRTGGVEALANIAKNKNFRSFFGLGARRVKKELALFFQEAIESGDIAMVATAATVLREPDLDFQEALDSIDFLTIAQNELQIPKEIEIYNELQKTIDFFIGKTETVLKTPDYNHPIDWSIVNEISERTQIKVRTKKGDITLKLFKKEAPATVANFVQLAKNGFFDGKKFHRVVPNFVIQGGCPRGDGYGGLDYTIRSELPRMSYNEEGYVGMASSGNHTECTQWFITHSPTLHLDGNYTIFAKVIEGMEVVHQIQIGDVIENVLVRN